jgi:hypothetical protein
MSAERVLCERELNRSLLARQSLLEPSEDALASTVQRIGGVQAQYAPSMYVGLWSRMAGLERADLTQAIERRKVIQGTLMLVGKSRAEGVGLWVDLVRAPPSGTWERRRADLFALASNWIGPARPTSRRTTPSACSCAATSPASARPRARTSSPTRA